MVQIESIDSEALLGPVTTKLVTKRAILSPQTCAKNPQAKESSILTEPAVLTDQFDSVGDYGDVEIVCRSGAC